MSANSQRNPGTQPLPAEAPNTSLKLINEIDSPSLLLTEMVLQQEDSTDPASEQATETGSTKTETPDPAHHTEPPDRLHGTGALSGLHGHPTDKS